MYLFVGACSIGNLEAAHRVPFLFSICLDLEDDQRRLHLQGVVDKTLTPSPWTTLMDYSKMDYP